MPTFDELNKMYGICAIKFKAARNHFLRIVFVTVAVLDVKTPYLRVVRITFQKSARGDGKEERGKRQSRFLSSPSPPGAQAFRVPFLYPNVDTDEWGRLRRNEAIMYTYNPALPRISNIPRKHFNILHSSNRCKDVFKQTTFVAYRRSPNLRDILVKVQLPVISNNHFPLGSFRCGQNWATCPYMTNGIPFALQVKHPPSLHTLLVTLKT